MAGLYRAQGRYTEAEQLFKRGHMILEKAFGPEHPSVATSLNNMAILYRAQGRDADAEALYKRSLSISEKTLGPEHSQIVTVLDNLAYLALVRGDWAGAADYWRRSTGIIKRRSERGVAGGRDEQFAGEVRKLRGQFLGLVKATHRLSSQGSYTASLGTEMFLAAQW